MSPKTTDAESIKKIRENTRSEHNRVEKIIGTNHLENASINRDDLRELLESYYGLFKTLEDKLVPLELKCLETFSYESRTTRLREDLRTLGLSKAEIEEIPVFPETEVNGLDDSGEVMGALYVIEGSEHGNTVIHKQLEDSLEEDVLEADSFFHDDHEQLRERWNRFKNDFNACITTDASLKNATEGAKKMFKLFGDWFS